MARRLLLLNGIAILCVILFHSTGWGFTALFFWTHRYLPVTSPNFDQFGSASYYVMRLIEQLVYFSIPSFLFVSGYFVAFLTGRSKETISWKVVGTRIKFLIIPYLLWSGLVLVLKLLEGERITPLVLLRLILVGGANPAYYFVPLLIQFYLISPLLVRLVKKNMKWMLIITGILQIIVYLAQYPISLGVSNPFLNLFGLKWLFLMRIFWFTAGIAAGFHLVQIKETLSRYRAGFVVAMVVLFVIGFFEWELLLKLSGQPWIETRETLVDGLYTVAFLLAFLGFSDQPMPAAKQLENLGSKSFGIYLVHSPVMEYFSRAVYALAPWLLANQILLMILLIILGLGVPLALMYIVNKSPARPFYSYQFG